MKYIVKTASGAVYHFDNEAMTWSRHHPSRDIIGLPDVNGGDLDEPVKVVLDERLVFYTLGTYIRTTPVVEIEEDI